MLLCRTFKFFMDYEEANWKLSPALNLLLRAVCILLSCLVWMGESFVLLFKVGLKRSRVFTDFENGLLLRVLILSK